VRPLSPCVSVCILDPANGYCRGCWRTIGEIAGWLDMSDDGKRAVLAALPSRQSAAAPAKRDY
jgi:predicted Fe-S protein YdhL (DUF1289 family)